MQPLVVAKLFGVCVMLHNIALCQRLHSPIPHADVEVAWDAKAPEPTTVVVSPHQGLGGHMHSVHTTQWQACGRAGPVASNT